VARVEDDGFGHRLQNLHRQLALEYTLPEPVSGKIGLWSKTDSTSYFKDYLVEPL
jgi:hypothetical protein